MRDNQLGREVAALWGFALGLCDLLDRDHPAVLGADGLLDEVRTVRSRSKLSPDAAEALTALEQFVRSCRGRWGDCPPALRAVVITIRQQLAPIASGLAEDDAIEAGYWSDLLGVYAYTGHPDLPRIVESAAAFLAQVA